MVLSFFLHEWRDSNPQQRFWRPVWYPFTIPVYFCAGWENRTLGSRVEVWHISHYTNPAFFWWTRWESNPPQKHCKCFSPKPWYMLALIQYINERLFCGRGGYRTHSSGFSVQRNHLICHSSNYAQKKIPNLWRFGIKYKLLCYFTFNFRTFCVHHPRQKYNSSPSPYSRLHCKMKRYSLKFSLFIILYCIYLYALNFFWVS